MFSFLARLCDRVSYVLQSCALCAHEVLGETYQIQKASFIFGQVCPTSALITAAIPHSLREPPWPLSYYRAITTSDTYLWKAWSAQMWLGRAPDAKRNGEDTPHLQDPPRAEIPPTTMEFSPLYCCVCPLSVHLSGSIPPRSPTLASVRLCLSMARPQDCGS